MSRVPRAIVRLALLTLALAALVAVWELLARQSPGTALYLGQLPGPIAALRETALNLGLLLLAAGLLMQVAVPEADHPPLLLVLLPLGVALALGAGVYGAVAGLNGVQLADPRPDAMPLFVVKHLGLLLVASGLLELGRRALFTGAAGGGS